MSRRHLSFFVVVFASLVVSACSASPTAPAPKSIGFSGSNGDLVTAPDTTAVKDTTSRIGFSGSNG